ncbi:siroheme decarboxylase [Gammaproteobacteria bacterium]
MARMTGRSHDTLNLMLHLMPLARRLINRFQGGFPVTERPFLSIATALDSDEVTLIATLSQLLAEGWLSRFGPLYDPERFGGAVTLAAVAAPADRLSEVVAQINALPAVAHHYQRDHDLNLWFVVATETPDGITQTLDRITTETGLTPLNFPRQRAFYLGLWLELDEDGGVHTRPVPEAFRASPAGVMTLDDTDRRLIAETQTGLPVTSRPYEDVAERLGLSGIEVCHRLTALLASGVIRRIGLVPNHYRLGLKGNGMSVWDVPDEAAESVGVALGGCERVSHCYLRPRHVPDWPYNLFAMIHGRDRPEVEAEVTRLATWLGPQVRQHRVLFSQAILKKSGLRIAV